MITALRGSTTSKRGRGGILAYRTLVWNFALRDLKSRFKGTWLGWLWSLLLPLATVVIYSVVFSLIIRVVPPDFGDGRPGIYYVWLLTGLVAWNFFSTSVTAGMPSLLGNGALLQKVFFPSYVPVAASVVAIAVQSSIELAIVLGLMVWHVGLSPVLILLPVWVLLLVTFSASVSYVLAVANVFARDLAHLVTVFLQLLFFLTPVIYPITQIPASWHGIPIQTLMSLSPVTQFVEIGRDMMYLETWPSVRSLAYVLAWTIIGLVISRLVYTRWGQDIGEAV